MDTLLIFFALPIAVIIISAILEILLKNPIAVASLVFAVFLIVTFAAFDETFLIATLAYTLLALLTAFIVHILRKKCHRENDIYNLILDLIQNNNSNTESNNNGNNNNTGSKNSNTGNTGSNNNENNNNNSSNAGGNANNNYWNCGCSRCRRR